MQKGKETFEETMEPNYGHVYSEASPTMFNGAYSQEGCIEMNP